MMKIKIAVLLVCGSVYANALSFAQYNTQSGPAAKKAQKVPPGKEIITIDGVERIANKGALITQQGSATMIEGFQANTARRLDIAETDITALQQQLREARNEIQQLRTELAKERAERTAAESALKQTKPTDTPSKK